jgi:hypothetical protein
MSYNFGILWVWMNVTGVAMSLYGPRERAKKTAAAKLALISDTSDGNNITERDESKNPGAKKYPRFLQMHGREIAENGYSIIPLIPGNKYSKIKGWQKIDSTPAMVEFWHENGFEYGGIGVLTKNNPAIDIDIRDEEIADMVKDFITKEFNSTVFRTGQPPKCLSPFKTDKPFKKIKSQKFQSPDGNEHQIEILADGQQFVAYGIHPDTKKPYTYSGDDLLSVKSDDLPELTPEDAEEVIKHFESIVPKDWIVVGSNSPKKDYKATAVETKRDNNLSNKVLNNLKRHLNQIDSDDYDTWIKVGMATSNETNNSDEGLILWDKWSQTSPKYSGFHECEKRWRSFNNTNDQKKLTAGFIVAKARQSNRIQLGIDGVFEKLELGPKSRVLNTFNNIAQILEYDQNIGLVQFDELKQADVINGRPVEDKDVLLAKKYMYGSYGTEFNTGLIHEAFVVVAHNNSFNPIAQYLEPLTWDEVPRIDTLLIDHAGADDNEYVRAITRKTLVAAVARALNPGCKFDCMLILEGEQSIGKSSFIAALVPDNEWFSDTELNIGHKDAYQQLGGIWIQELGEMAGATKSDVRSLKAFLSSKSDNYRPAYARKNRVFPRRIIFIGTTNDDEYLRDETGGRRFWPVKVTKLNFLWVINMRDQLWAEAKAVYDAGENLFLEDNIELLAKEEQD